MLLKLYDNNTNPKDLKRISECLQAGGVIIYPTDTIYAIGCDINNRSAIERVAKIKGAKVKKANFSFIFIIRIT